ncbi:MAG TPA: methyltransferase domain-containing protein [Pirellulales bacterium]|nr:methyltransferase domain-containing protein [Pirellulales bacterium]
MTTDYNTISRQYQLSKLQPWRAHIEAHSLLGLVGDLAGQSVLDVACGEGFYTRLLKEQGASAAMGVDLSERMIDLARAQEAAEPRGIRYEVADAAAMQLDSQFDVVVAAYLLNYAHNRQELAAMCRGLARSLRPGGRFVTVNSSPLLDFRQAPSFRKYGFETSMADGAAEGAPITWTFHLADGSFSIENYFLNREIHEEALQEAGFREVRWHAPHLDPAGAERFGADFWDDFMSHSPIALIECVK